MAKKIGKINFKQVATNTLTAAASGAIASVLSNAVLPDNPDTVDYAMIAAGIILPEVVKGNAMVDSASTALIAVGAYRMSERLDLAGKLGINETPATAGVNYGNIGKGWNPQGKNIYTDKTKKQKTSGASSVL
jgi:hypothetical protein